jgi:hypothetical protein
MTIEQLENQSKELEQEIAQTQYHVKYKNSTNVREFEMAEKMYKKHIERLHDYNQIKDIV